MTIAACEIMLSCCASEPVHDCRCAADNNVLPTSARTYLHVPYVAALNLSAWLCGCTPADNNVLPTNVDIGVLIVICVFVAGAPTFYLAGRCCGMSHQ